MFSFYKNKPYKNIHIYPPPPLGREGDTEVEGMTGICGLDPSTLTFRETIFII